MQEPDCSFYVTQQPVVCCESIVMGNAVLRAKNSSANLAVRFESKFFLGF
jgi:hypothetical protein